MDEQGPVDEPGFDLPRCGDPFGPPRGDEPPTEDTAVAGPDAAATDPRTATSGCHGTEASAWAVPGVPRPPVPVELPVALHAVLSGLRELLEVDAGALSGRQALADLAGVLEAARLAERLVLKRTADAHTRKLGRGDGARTLGQWVAQHGGGVSAQQLTVARRLGAFPVVDAALLDGTLPVAAGQKLHATLAVLRRHVDRQDGLLDGRDAEAAVTHVITEGVRMAVAQARGGFPTLTDPVLRQLTSELAGIAALPLPQLTRLEQALVLLAAHVEAAQLTGALAMLSDALLPSRLEDAARRAEDRRYLTVLMDRDGGFCEVRGRLDLGCGERLKTVLDAAVRQDPDNVLDTDVAAGLRAQGLDPHDPHLAPTLSPRNRGQRLHDALDLVLTRYLGAELGGSHDGNPVQVSVILTQPALDDAPGALPAVSGTGTLLPASLWKRLLCGSAFTRFVLDLRGRVIETSHTGRTLKPHERRALHAQTGGQCQGAGCNRSVRHLGTVLHPHHGNPWSRCGTTSLAETAHVCDHCHAYVHQGHPLRLKDGRLLGPDGFLDG